MWLVLFLDSLSNSSFRKNIKSINPTTKHAEIFLQSWLVGDTRSVAVNNSIAIISEQFDLRRNLRVFILMRNSVRRTALPRGRQEAAVGEPRLLTNLNRVRQQSKFFIDATTSC